jgi:hypothetical protein
MSINDFLEYYFTKDIISIFNKYKNTKTFSKYAPI